MILFLAVKSPGNFAELLVLRLPVRLECPPNSESIREQERSGLKMIVVVHSRMKNDNVRALFGAG